MPQSLAQILVHVIFSTKNRARSLPQAMHHELVNVTGSILRGLDSPLVAMGVVPDHIHFVCALHRTISIAKIVEEVKVDSSRLLKEHKLLPPTFHWQNGYGAFSVSASQMPVLERYIANQPKHHGRVSFQDEFRKFLKRYNLAYDERYVWD